MPRVKGKAESTTANLGFEAKLWAAADALRNNMDAAEYKHVVLGLIFLKYISDAFEEEHAGLEAQKAQGADPEDRDEYRADRIFWVPKEARWSHLKACAPQPTIGTLVDDAMSAIERDNSSLKGVLPKDYARPGLGKQRLGQIISLVSDIALGSAADRTKDTLGRVYEYFLARFASAEGKSGGRFYTPTHVVRVLVETLAPYRGRVYDPYRAVCSMEFLVPRARLPCGRSYVYSLARSVTFRRQIETLVTGTSKSHQRAQVDAVPGLDVALPPGSVVGAFATMLEAWLERALACRRESRTLAALRDALLPKLVSGDLRVTAAGSSTEEVLA